MSDLSATNTIKSVALQSAHGREFYELRVLRNSTAKDLAFTEGDGYIVANKLSEGNTTITWRPTFPLRAPTTPAARYHYPSIRTVMGPEARITSESTIMNPPHFSTGADLHDWRKKVWKWVKLIKPSEDSGKDRYYHTLYKVIAQML